MANKLLVAVDGSETGKRAISFAAQAAKDTGNSIVLAYVIEWSPYSFHTSEELEERHMRRESEISPAEGSVLAPEAAGLRSAGIEVETVVRHGHIGETLSEIAGEHNVSLLEPFIDTIVICTITALVIGTTQVVAPGFAGDATGVAMTSKAFEYQPSWFPIPLAFAAVLFAFSTMISWSYYGLKGWSYLFGEGEMGQKI